ncbi:MarR family winged helix-turn-helix transcriptional regulator [Rhizosaccharibacter radicis]|uniref:MarR family transcriptional regulator n=1 Tax=Rhizosaccharibacter radicis TaxID=2782605 RepID=A0ABT1W099_9PROT|nr:MarR family transcriptional regulator [Acetobacteraceae bacterium KSS12]
MRAGAGRTRRASADMSAAAPAGVVGTPPPAAPGAADHAEPRLTGEDPGIAFGRRLLRLGFAWRREIDADLRPFGLTDASWRPILLLGTLGEPVRQGVLARMLEVDGPSLARVVDALERDGLVSRSEDPLDRRTKHVHITEAGMAIHAAVQSRAAAVGRRLLAAVPPDALAACQAVLDGIERAMTAPGRRQGEP